LLLLLLLLLHITLYYCGITVVSSQSCIHCSRGLTSRPTIRSHKTKHDVAWRVTLWFLQQHRSYK